MGVGGWGALLDGQAEVDFQKRPSHPCVAANIQEKEGVVTIRDKTELEAATDACSNNMRAGGGGG
eukprot:757352-Hanusia_phi.AAC.1